MKQKTIRKIKAERIKEKRTEIRVAKEIAWVALFVLATAGMHWILGTPKPLLVLTGIGMLCYSCCLVWRDRLLLNRPRRGPSLKLRYLMAAGLCWQAWSKIALP